LKIDGLAQQFRTSESERPNSFSGVAGDAAVGEEIGRVGEDEVDGRFGDLGEEFEAVAVVDAEVMFGVVEGGGAESGGRFGHDDDRSGSLIRRVRVSSGEGETARRKERCCPKGTALRKSRATKMSGALARHFLGRFPSTENRKMPP
jgi:hypothetical protein